MRHLQRTAWAISIAVALIVGASACGGEAPADHPGHGIVKSLDADAREVTLDHGDIEGLMDAMTMTYKLAPGVALDGIAEGAEVDFRVKKEGGVYTVTEMRRTGP